MTKEEQPEPIYTFDIDKMQVTTKLNSLHQEGNYLVGVTESGVKFRQSVGPGKELYKEGDHFRLRDRAVG